MPSTTRHSDFRTIDMPASPAEATPRSPGVLAQTPTEIIHHQPAIVPTHVVPGVGQSFAGFQLIRELGRGGFGRVFLAEQSDLAGRFVALKITMGQAAEVRTLARLQHTNIVPIYSAHRQDGLTAVCMPYFGRTTLASVVSDLITGEPPRTGQAILGPMQRRRGQAPAVGHPVPAAVSFLESASFVDAVLWLGERLADALDHAHERGIIHRDIKPANILLADDGQPMLLDFNVADDGNEADRARVGGTLSYMSPEQILAFAGGPRIMDARTDVYALGAVLYQLLAHRMAFPDQIGKTDTILPQIQADRAGPIPLIRPHNPDVSPAVESIVRTCLHLDPNERYPSAAALREDLLRQRTHRSLLFAREPSLAERAGKWRRRHPRLVSPASLGIVAAVLLLLGSAVGVQLSLSARERRQDQERLVAQHQFEDFLLEADRIKLTAGSPGGSAETLTLGHRALQSYEIADPNWQERDAVKRLSTNDRARLASELGELAYLTGKAAAVMKRDGGDLQQLAEQLLGVGLATGDGERGDFLHACELAALGQYRNALLAADRFSASHPKDFGGWFLKARCHDGLGQFEEARAAYGTCAALRPQSARPMAARGELIFRHGRDLHQAKADLDRALTLETELDDARFTRALVLRAMRKFDDALLDLNVLLEKKRTPTRVYLVRAQVREAQGDCEGAAQDRVEGMSREPDDAASFVTRGMARAAKEPAAALKDFQAAEAHDPFFADALVNQAWLLGDEMDRLDEAVEAVDRLLAMYPDHQNARTGRAVLYARQGKNDLALDEARRCLAGEPHASATYQAGCVFAVMSKNDPKHRDESLRLLASALLQGFGHEYVLTDGDLDPLRTDERFRKLRDGVRVMKDLGSPREAK